jgi:hypothetical protein
MEGVHRAMISIGARKYLIPAAASLNPASSAACEFVSCSACRMRTISLLLVQLFDRIMEALGKLFPQQHGGGRQLSVACLC